jgi:hypothetical protein
VEAVEERHSFDVNAAIIMPVRADAVIQPDIAQKRQQQPIFNPDLPQGSRTFYVHGDWLMLAVKSRAFPRRIASRDQNDGRKLNRRWQNSSGASLASMDFRPHREIKPSIGFYAFKGSLTIIL